MSKLRHKIFYTILGILSIALFSFLLAFNIQNYTEQKDNVKRNLNFNSMSAKNPPGMFNRNIRFMDSNIITVRLDSSDNVIEIYDYSNEQINVEEVKQLVQDILNIKDKEREHIGLLYFDKYSYSYSATSGFIKGFQSNGGAIVVGYYGNPTKEGIDFFDSRDHV